MARKNTPPQQTPDPELTEDADEVERKIEARIATGEELHARDISTEQQLEFARSDYRRWDAYNKEMLGRLFTTQKFSEEYSRWGVVAVSIYPKSAAEKLTELKDEIRERIHRLRAICDRLDLIPVSKGVLSATRGSTQSQRTNKVFVVHGHDGDARESVARFIERLGLETIILHEQATGGRTIVEKLEHYSNVDFAVVLLTPDDVGGHGIAGPNELQPRARQNVILELGFFVGKLGRQHVCALFKGPLELPSDFLGVGYVPLDAADGWRLRLAKELRVAGFNVDMNLAV